MSQRTEKVQKVAKEVLGRAIQDLKDPRVGFATVTAVRVTPDLRSARVFVSVLGSEDEKAATMEGLASATPHLRTVLGHEVRLKYLPELNFHLDTGAEEAEHLEEIFRRIHTEDRAGEPDVAAAATALDAARSVALACHVNPDGDALGSLLGAALALAKLGKEVSAAWDGGPDLPSGYAFLPGADLLVPPGEVPDADVFVALDCGAADRLGVLEEKARGHATLVNIDHHPGNDGFGAINIVLTDASSTAELVARLLTKLDVEMDVEIATCLYTGVFTDTGSFQYENSSPATLRLAADLLEHGVPKTRIAQEVFEAAPFAYLKLLANVLGRAVLLEEEGFVYSTLLRADLEETGVAMEETDKVIDVLRSTRDADVTALFKEQDDGLFRVSLRSRGPSVGAIARTLGGGGHELAAGFTADDVERTVARMIDHLRRGRGA